MTAMRPFLLVLFLTLECNCQEDARFYSLPSRYFYADEDINAKQYFKASRRSDDRIASPRYSAEEANYPDYPKSATIEIAPQEYRISKIGETKKPTPTIEQYLKEVTPTTKIPYDHRQKVAQRAIARPSAGHYVHLPHQDLQRKSATDVVSQSFEIPDDTSGIYKNSQDALQKNLLAFRDVVLAHQDALAAQQKLALDTTDSRSAIYVDHSIPKKKTTGKIAKPKPHPNEDEVDFYERVQQYQQQEPEVYEKAEPAPPKFQAKLQSYQDGRQEVGQFWPQLEAYQPLAARQGIRVEYAEKQRVRPSAAIQQQDNAHLYQEPAVKYERIVPADAVVRQSSEAARYQQTVLANAARYQPQIDEDGQPRAVEDVQYRHQGGFGIAGVRQKAPESKTLQYQASEGEKQGRLLTNEEAIQKYREIIARFQQAEALKAIQSSKQAETQVGHQRDRYIVYAGKPQEQTYEEPENVKIAPTTASRSRTYLRHRQPQPSNIRYLKTPIRHVVYSSE